MKITWYWENRQRKRKVRAIPALLDLIDISGDTITIDAMGCRKEIVKKIRAKQADYVLTVKGNQPILYQEVREYFAYLDDEKTGDGRRTYGKAGLRMAAGG